MQQIYRKTPTPNCDFNKVKYRTSAWVFSCKFGAYLQNTFFQEHIWVAVSEFLEGNQKSFYFFSKTNLMILKHVKLLLFVY